MTDQEQKRNKEIEYKRCTRCKEEFEKNSENFVMTEDGISDHCRDCWHKQKKEKSRQWYWENLPPAATINKSLIKRVAESIRWGVPRLTAAKEQGISPETHYIWLKKARNGHEPYPAYLEAIEKAEAEAESDLIKRLNKFRDRFGSEQSDTIKFLLERRFRDNFSKELKVEAQKKLEEIVQLLPKYMSEKAYLEFINAIYQIQNENSIVKATLKSAPDLQSESQKLEANIADAEFKEIPTNQENKKADE